MLSLVFLKESRTMLVQYLWSFYVVLQFWALCRGKTLTWRQTALFVMAGALLVVPFTAFTVNAVHALAGGRARDTWSQAVLTPIVEEAWKLLPLGALLLFSRRASALGLCDYALAGAASGAGFQLAEELSRRWTNAGKLSDLYGYSYTMLGGETIHWDFFALFPGRFEESVLPSLMTVSHPVHTAMVALGVGAAVRFGAKRSRWLWLLPVLLLLWAILDHAAYNGQGSLPDWVMTVHAWTGSGYKTRAAFLLLLAAAVCYDYWTLNLVRRKLPLLPGELPVLNPFSELWGMVEALFRDRGSFAYRMGFYRQRRELAYLLLYGNAEALGREDAVRERTKRLYRAAAGLGAVLLAAGAAAGFAAWAQLHAAVPSADACFACLFDSLQNWWDRLSGLEKGAIIVGALALGLLFLEFWPALGLALTIPGVAGSGHEIAADIRDPKRLLTPENAIAAVAAIVLSRLPFGRAAEWLGKKARGPLERLLKKLGRLGRKEEPDMPGGKPPREDGGAHPDRGDGPDAGKEKDGDRDGDEGGDRDDDAAPAAGNGYREVEIVDQRGNPIGEFDEIDAERGIFYEDKTARGLDIVNPRTGLPTQTPQEFADKQILAKTRTRIHNLAAKAAGTRATAHGTPDVPSLERIRSIKHFVFRLDGDTPALRSAVENSLNALRAEFPDHTFQVLFRGKP
ncbi:Membrane proteinase PrsW, cleaves anti-sigma factor RsiW, M82 family [Paenibacillus sp. UNC496MF]|uniref:PrsW family glutamic-type intramembrane protease n=1 Tax=Paenibacillus sp. UNC496MF TaxID=1502753 RepID=UPI0008E88C6F|nr:PrsW family glutamic-type intramembrane protease [Paenibacillus sp. UNC496MF]SFI86992.1 Membrane proteinase PrsW, cleaves anti-sigma factor RsiW, M82 family [Paenibacillus sp. UNC496MF]